MSFGSKFAHLLGMSASEDDEEKKSRRAEEEEQGEQAEDDDEGDDGKEPKSKKAEDDSDDASAEEEQDEDQDKESADVKKGRKAENKRCAAIFASAHAAHNVELAAHLAFETRMSVSQAIGTMKMASQSAAPTSISSRLDQRMSAFKQPNVGQDTTAKGMSVADKMKAVYDKAHKHARGEK